MRDVVEALVDQICTVQLRHNNGSGFTVGICGAT